MSYNVRTRAKLPMSRISNSYARLRKITHLRRQHERAYKNLFLRKFPPPALLGNDEDCGAVAVNEGPYDGGYEVGEEKKGEEAVEGRRVDEAAPEDDGAVPALRSLFVDASSGMSRVIERLCGEKDILKAELNPQGIEIAEMMLHTEDELREAEAGPAAGTFLYQPMAPASVPLPPTPPPSLRLSRVECDLVFPVPAVSVLSTYSATSPESEPLDPEGIEVYVSEHDVHEEEVGDEDEDVDETWYPVAQEWLEIFVIAFPTVVFVVLVCCFAYEICDRLEKGMFGGDEVVEV